MRRTIVPSWWLLLVSLFVFSPMAIADSLFRVGVIAPLTGPLAEYGLACRNGIELAREERPELFSGIRFQFEDSQWDAKSAVAAFQHLRAQLGVSLIFNWGNPTTEALAPLADRFGVPLIGLTLDPASARGRKFVVRATNPASDFSDRLADYLAKRPFRRIGIVIAENSYVQGLYEGLKRKLPSDRSIEIIASHAVSDVDFRTSVTKLKAGRFDAIGVFLISGQVSAFYRQLAQQGVEPVTFGTDFFESSTEIKLAEGGMEGAVYPHLGVTPEFETAYVRRFENDYQLAYAANAYDMAVLIGTLFGKSPVTTAADDVVKKLESSGPLEGVTGRFAFKKTSDGDRYFEFPVRLKKILRGRIVALPEDEAK